MKNTIKKITLKLYKFLKKANQDFQSLELKDKKGVIIDQLFFNLSTIETIKLLNDVVQEAENRMEIQKQDALKVITAITEYHKDDTTE